MLGETGRHGQVRVFNDIPAVCQGGESFCVAYLRVEEVALFLHCCSPWVYPPVERRVGVPPMFAGRPAPHATTEGLRMRKQAGGTRRTCPALVCV